jgi:hypothetical protein
MWFSYLMLRNLVPEGMTATEQRMADEQLGETAAALARVTWRIAARAHAVAALPARRGHQARVRKPPRSRREPDLAARR